MIQKDFKFLLGGKGAITNCLVCNNPYENNGSTSYNDKHLNPYKSHFLIQTDFICWHWTMTQIEISFIKPKSFS